MKFALAFAAILAVASTQYNGFRQQSGRYGLLPPQRSIPRPPAPAPSAVVSRVSNSNEQNANILRYDNNIEPDGSFNYVVETDNGISAQAQGTPRDFGGNPPLRPDVISGSFAWTSPEGQPIGISYIADENGYQPSGDAIPTPHPIPDAILRAIEWNKAHPE